MVELMEFSDGLDVRFEKVKSHGEFKFFFFFLTIRNWEEKMPFVEGRVTVVVVVVVMGADLKVRECNI